VGRGAVDRRGQARGRVKPSVRGCSIAPELVMSRRALSFVPGLARQADYRMAARRKATEPSPSRASEAQKRSKAQSVTQAPGPGSVSP
jgi:hypothetical protein